MYTWRGGWACDFRPELLLRLVETNINTCHNLLCYATHMTSVCGKEATLYIYIYVIRPDFNACLALSKSCTEPLESFTYNRTSCEKLHVYSFKSNGKRSNTADTCQQLWITIEILDLFRRADILTTSASAHMI